MTVSDLLQKTSVSFAEELPLDKYVTLLNYVSSSLPNTTLEYTTSKKTTLTNIDSKVEPSDGIVHVAGTITRKGTPAVFETIYDMEGLATGMKFTPNEHDYNSHSKEKRMLWDDVQTVVELYFKNR